MLQNILRVTLTVIGLIAHFAVMLFGKKTDLNAIKAMWWDDETLKRAYTVGAKLDNRASKDKEYIQRHKALRKKVRYFLDLADIRRKVDMV
jgi:hypothetical protein